MMHKMLHLDWIITLADNDLRKVNRMCNLAGINVQYPMLDDDIVDFSTQLTAQHMVKRNQLRYFFKRAMKGFLPDKVLTKSKHGFGLPFGVWMKTYKPLQDISYDSLNSIKKRNIISHKYINQLIEKHQHDHAAYYGEFIWVLMMLELWFQTHSDNS
jgi:asparagine synthase (glutamine-hydrolysing)